jgi:hypothetical protein
MNQETPPGGTRVFNTPGEFHEWRERKLFNMTDAAADCACLSLYIHALMQTSSPLLTWPVGVRKADGHGFVVNFGGTTDVRIFYSAITSPPRSATESNTVPEKKKRWPGFFSPGRSKSPPERGETGNDGVEHDWAHLALDILRERLVHLNTPGFSMLARNELIMNTPAPHPDLDLPVAIDLLGANLNKESADGRYPRLFDAITFIYDSLTIPRALSKRNG